MLDSYIMQQYNNVFLPVQTGASSAFLARNTVHGEDVVREEEQWTNSHSTLLQTWCHEWHIRTELHEDARRWWKQMHYFLAIPNAIIPLVVASIWGKMPEEEGSFIATAALTLAGCVGALLTLVQPEAQSEKHLHASHRYADLISDVEESLSKHPRFRTDSDITIQGLKMRSDALLRISPALHLNRLKDLESGCDDDSEQF